MHHLFTSNHVKLLNSCYPPASTLLTAGPDYSPNSHELSRLTYYASNHPGKLTKIGSELENRLRGECRKAHTGNTRYKASLLISLAILRALATECRRDIALLSPFLVASVDYTLASVSSDLEVLARVATVFTAWTTYTNGHLIGADSLMTKDYLSALRQFARLSRCDLKDQETENRTRLIGLAALTGALSSEALYNDSSQFQSQVAIILGPIMTILFQTELFVLDEQSSAVKDTPASPYLAEFRTRPALERRAASIHIHVDGDKGPSVKDVSDAALRALFSLINHANGAQLGHIMQSSFDNLDDLKGWSNPDHCCWFAQVAAEWAQYQYRYVVPTWLVERLISHQEAPAITSLHTALIAMVTTVFSSPTPLINLSSSDIMSNLLTLLLRRVSLDPGDPTLKAVVECISSLGCHVYYSDQIQDLAGELINRLVAVEVQGVLARDNVLFARSRSSALRHLLSGLTGLVRVANANETNNSVDDNKKSLSHSHKVSPSLESPRKDRHIDERTSRRTKVPPDIWQDTLSLLCDDDPSIRSECAAALLHYLTQEMPTYGETSNPEGTKRFRGLADHSFHHAINTMFPHSGDPASKFLNAVHAYIFILATSHTLSSPSINYTSPTPPDTSGITTLSETTITDLNSEIAVPSSDGNRRPSNNTHVPRSRKESLILKLLDKTPTHLNTPAGASEEDYSNILKILTTIQQELPIRGLVAGIPMVIALDSALKPVDEGISDPNYLSQVLTIKTLIANVWLSAGEVWRIPQLVTLSQGAIFSLSKPSSPPDTEVVHQALGVNADEALSVLTACNSVQRIFGIDPESLHRRLATTWTPTLALRDLARSTGYESTFRGDGLSPLLKISPALMHIENISLQSLARSTRGLGVTDLREALEGRSSMSNPALVRPPSVSTMDHASSFVGDASLRLTQTRSRSRTKKRSAPNGAGEVRDVLTKLGIGKHNTNLLKASFPALQKS